MKTGNLLGGLESPKFTTPQLAPPSPSFAGFTRQQSPAPGGAQVVPACQILRASLNMFSDNAADFVKITCFDLSHNSVDCCVPVRARTLSRSPAFQIA